MVTDQNASTGGSCSLREAQRVRVGAVVPLAVGVDQRERVEGVLDQVAADAEERPGRAVGVLGAVAAEVAGQVPAVDAFAELGLLVADRLLRPATPSSMRGARVGVERGSC